MKSAVQYKCVNGQCGFFNDEHLEGVALSFRALRLICLWETAVDLHKLFESIAENY